MKYETVQCTHKGKTLQAKVAMPENHMEAIALIGEVNLLEILQDGLRLQAVRSLKGQGKRRKRVYRFDLETLSDADKKLILSLYERSLQPRSVPLDHPLVE